jgi:hypothetical protein
MATVTNLSIDQGTTYSVTFTVNDDTGTARDLTNYQARSQMRRSYYTTANTAFTAIVTSPLDGEVNISLTSTQTSALKDGRYVYDIELQAPGGAVERIVEGIVTVYPEATK